MTWIDTLEQQPESLDDVLVAHWFDGELVVDVAYFYAGRWYLSGAHGGRLEPPPTHWMPMPEPPLI